ncbi:MULTISPECIES: hypothetical protein, partial [unclassified Desulfovibrio]|uniref:hypothetical protein n=1 Tax=unclassified Desulfovibrio TaxID=2593640 RepID=UPI00163A985F
CRKIRISCRKLSGNGATGLHHDFAQIDYEMTSNIALHLAHSFAEKGFQVWAEVPLKEENRRIDFFAYNYPEGITVALEFKKSIETPQGNYEDLKRLVDIHENGVCNAEHRFNNQSLSRAEPKEMYGVVTLLSAEEFADWWKHPKNGDYTPNGRSARDYRRIGKAIDVAGYRFVVPLVEYFCSAKSTGDKYRFRRAAYALYRECDMENLKEVLLENP